MASAWLSLGPPSFSLASSPARASSFSAPPSSSSSSSSSISPSLPSIRFNDSSSTSFSPLLNGCWTLAGGHGFIPEPIILRTLNLYSRSGFSTFDTADIYGPSESILGKFLASWKTSPTFHDSPLPQVHIFTKFVPNIFTNKPTPEFVKQSVLRSMKALGVQKLDLVQLHWWDYSVPGMVDVALSLTDLKEKGLITSVGTTNMSTDALAKIVDAGVPVVSNQVQFSLLDRRPLQQMLAYCKERDIKLLTYGSLAGGLLSDRYLKARVDLNTSSLKMYWRILREAGGETFWRKLLAALSDVAGRKSVSIANVALRWVMLPLPSYHQNGDHFILTCTIAE